MTCLGQDIGDIIGLGIKWGNGVRNDGNIGKSTPNVAKDELREEEKPQLTPHEERMAFIKRETENVSFESQTYHSPNSSNDTSPSSKIKKGARRKR